MHLSHQADAHNLPEKPTHLEQQCFPLQRFKLGAQVFEGHIISAAAFIVVLITAAADFVSFLVDGRAQSSRGLWCEYAGDGTQQRVVGCRSDSRTLNGE